MVGANTSTDAPNRTDGRTGPGGRRLPGQRGFALLIVLFALGFLALLETYLLSAGHAGTALARNNRATAEVEAATAGAIQDEIFALLLGRGPGATVRQVRIGTTLVNVTVADEGSRLNPNLADSTELAILLQEVGADTRTANSLAAQILDWRTASDLPRPGGAKAPQYRAAGRVYGPADMSFHSTAELGLVLDMTPALLVRLRPHVTVFTSYNPMGASSDPMVARVLQAATPAGSPPAGGDLGAIAVQRITAAGRGPDGASSIIEAVVRLNATPDGPPFEILSWRRIVG